MKTLATLLFIAISLVSVRASPYLEFCSLLDIQTIGSQGIIIQANCGGTCQQLNIVPCFANSYGKITPAGTTNGNFNSTCSDCTLGVSQNDTESYGILSCTCASGAPDVLEKSTYQTDNAIRYETSLGMVCPYSNSSAIRSVPCGTVSAKQHSVVGSKRDRKVRHTIRSSQQWKP